jgi:hypothetical protein
MVIPCSFLSAEKHSAALSMITWGVMDGTFKKALAVSAALALSRSSHLSDNNGKLASQVTKSSIASSGLIFERSSPSLNGEAIAQPLSNPSKPNVTQKAFRVIAILPTSLWERLAQSLTRGFAGFRFLNRIDLGLERVEPGDCARNADQINRLLGPLNFSFDGRSVSRPAPRSFKLQDPGPNSSVDVGAGADCKQ